MDRQDPLRAVRQKFRLPKNKDGKTAIYFLGNSLGAQPKTARNYVAKEMQRWANLGVEAFFEGDEPWLDYNRRLNPLLARMVGAKTKEVVAMSSLTVNIHAALTAFLKLTPERNRVVVVGSPFPSDVYAVDSQIRMRGFNPTNCLRKIAPRENEDLVRIEDIQHYFQQNGRQTALALVEQPSYLTGQAHDMELLTAFAHGEGCKIGFDLAHGFGNLNLKLHASEADFAVWCGYKFGNDGPGGVGGLFVHENHHKDQTLNHLAGWWGESLQRRFKMRPDFIPDSTAQGFQISTPSPLQLACLQASLEIYDEVGMRNFVQKQRLLTGYLEFLIGDLPHSFCEIITPASPYFRGSSLSLRVRKQPRKLVQALRADGIFVDFRNPNIVRAAPNPLYNRFEEVFRFSEILHAHAGR